MTADWRTESLEHPPGRALTDMETAEAIRKICEAFGASVPTQFQVAGLFVRAVQDHKARKP